MNRDYVAKNTAISQTDARLLAILQGDGRRSYAELGTDLGMAGPSAHERVKKLESRGVIRGYAADVDPAAVGLSVVAFTWVTQAPGTVSSDLTPDFAAIPEIEECHYIARRIQTTEHVFSTETDVVFTTGFEGRPLPLAVTPGERGETDERGSA
jgi:DNA-binding Lrp family transcriptional regulator